MKKNKILFSNIIVNRFVKKRNENQKNVFMKHKNSKHFVFYDGKFLFHNYERKFELKIFDNLIEFKNHFKFDFEKKTIFIGSIKKKNYFCHNILLKKDVKVGKSRCINKTLFLETNPKFGFYDSKCFLNRLSLKEANLISIAKSIFEWNNINNFCSKCGAILKKEDMGWLNKCSECEIKIFPRIDPVVIMLIKNKDHILLARSKFWPKGMFSCPAGFMEPGETIEDAVKRETFEEVGLKLKKIKYISSQPWPFPYSLMIGCSGETKNYKIKIDYEELEQAKWFSKKEVMVAFQGKSKWFPARKGAIARELIKNWLKN